MRDDWSYVYRPIYIFFLITEDTLVTSGLPMLQSWYNNIYVLLHAFRCLKDRQLLMQRDLRFWPFFRY